MSFLKKIFSSTKYTLLMCSIFLVFTLGIRGSLFEFFKIKSVNKKITEEVFSVELKSIDLKKKLEVVHDPYFIEKKIREQFDYAKEGDLVFIFSPASSL